MEITQTKKTSQSENKNTALGSLSAFLQKAKTDSKAEKFEKYIGNVLVFWFYQYLEIFHCKADTINDMVNGLKYIYFNRGET